MEQEVREYSDYDGMASSAQVDKVAKLNPKWTIKHMGFGSDYCYDTHINSHRPYIKIIICWEAICIPSIPFNEWE